MLKMPLNGTKTHPLSEGAKSVLARLERGPLPAQELNPGLVNRLLRERYVELVMLPTPYKTKVGKIPHLRLRAEMTDAS